mmetsp:Transcript_5503/g.9361  ORF Transcript_5503/g.9361 Transcript_5503/m.9361 type:complete len:210 (-) Transcript_5503:149-778(-)
MEDPSYVLTQATVPQPNLASRYRYAMICSSNINRSLEAHTVLANAGLDCESYGVGKQLRLPGPEGARRFDFGTPYSEIARTLQEEAEAHYTRVGVLQLAKRAAGTKLAPQRWQDKDTEAVGALDIVIVFETKLFETVVLDVQSRAPEQFLPLHIICMDTRDSPKDAVEKGKEVLVLCKQLEAADLSTGLPPAVLEIADRGEIQYMLAYV